MSMGALPKRHQARLTKEELAEGFFRLVSQEWRLAEAQPFLGRLQAIPSISAPFLVEHLVHGGPGERETATVLLRLLAGPRVIVPLREVLNDQSAADAARVAAALVLEGLGEEVNAGALSADLKDPEGLFHSTWETAIGRARSDEAFLEHLLQGIQGGPPGEREEMIRSLAEPGDPRALCLLRPLLYGRRVSTIAAAIDAIEALGGAGGLGALKEVSQADSSPQVRQRARAAYGRLVMRSNSLFADQVEPRPIQLALEEPLPLDRCWATPVDGRGDQALLVSRRRPDGLLKIISILISDTEGIKGCLGGDMLRDEEVAEIEADLQAQGLTAVPVGLDACRGMLEEARRRSLQERRRLPIEYEVWKGLLGGPPSSREAAWSDRCDEDEQGLLALLPQTDTLLAAPEFRQWFFDPGLVYPYVDEWSYAPMEQDGKSMLEQLVELAASDLIDEDCRWLLSRRLRRQAWMLEKLGKQEASLLAAAAGLGLDPEAGVPLQVNPFVRAMVLGSFLHAGLRISQRGLVKD